jgi:ActR/RegA family two-component response regulator
MHLHQELEEFYLGGTPAYAAGGASLSLAQKMPSNGSRVSGSRKHSKSVITPKTVLLILENFDEIRAFLVRHFDQKEYEVYSSATLRDALVLAWEESPKVMLIDYDLRGETALHAIQRLHFALPNSYIVLIGGPQTQEVTEQAILAGASKVLSKAYSISEMDYIVGNVAQIKHRTRVTHETESFS